MFVRGGMVRCVLALAACATACSGQIAQQEPQQPPAVAPKPSSGERPLIHSYDPYAPDAEGCLPRPEKDEENPESGLPPAIGYAPSRLAQEQTRSPSVGFAQRHLNRWIGEVERAGWKNACPKAYSPAPQTLEWSTVDCTFDRQMEIATQSFQKCVGLPANGKIDATTWQELLVFPSMVPVVVPDP